uniref:Plastocyanin-like domain-containing protein n=1 Tax=Fagus sylvatica TaxID=28930 RepID=A0A2N9HX05_FAGSY
MALFGVSLVSLVLVALFQSLCFGADPSVFYDLRVSYITASPLGVPQQVIAVNGKFPGPLITTTTNDNVFVTVWNDLDENLLMTWSGIQMRRNSWQDGVLGTNCPIHPKRNWTYSFQVKDQIGSFFYFPTLNFQRASGGFGPIIINNRVIISIPFPQPDGDITITIGDWYTQNHTALRSTLDAGTGLGMPDGVLINGKGPYRYNTTLVPDGIAYETIQVDPVTMDQNASSDYYIVASARFVNESLWQRVTGVAVLRYSNSKGPATGPLPDPPNDFYDKTWSLNQALGVRQNGSASGARPNPQGSFHYGSINVTHTYVIETVPPVIINGTLRTTLNGISFVNPDTPIRLADKHGVKGSYKLDFPDMPLNRTPRIDRSVINATYKGFIEVIFQNNDTTMQSFHIDGYSFFVVGMSFGEWTEASRNNYNKWDAISHSTTQVFPGGWTAVLISLDNVGVWNIRTENLDRWYLGQETYMKIVNPEENGETEMAEPGNVLFCGAPPVLIKGPEQ